MLSPEPAIANAVYIGYASPNKVVYESEEYAEAMEELTEGAMDILYGKSHTEINESYIEKFGKNSYCYRAYTPEIQAHLNVLWESLKTENSTELWVHITTIVIVGAVLTLAVYTKVVEKKRSRDYRLRDKANKLAKAKNIKK